MSQIISHFRQACKDNRKKDAFIYEEKNKIVVKTYKDLEEDTKNMINYLLNQGVKKGDRVLVFANYSYELCIFMLATMILGASIMYVDIWAKSKRLKIAFEQYKPKFVAVSRKTNKFRMFFREINKINKVLYVDKRQKDNSQKLDIEEIAKDQEALLTMTTGSTGRPKVAIRSHEDLYEQLILVEKNLDKSLDSEYVLTTSYMYVFVNILKGFTTVLPNIKLDKMSPNKLNKNLSKFKDLPITMIITSPDFCLKTNNIYKNLKKLYLGGAILNLYEANKINNKFGKADIVYIYGSTECILISKTKLKDYIKGLKNKGRSILGQVVNGTKLKIGAEDQIYVTSNALLEKYLNNEEEKNKRIDSENIMWHDTGDRGKYKNDLLIYFGRDDRYFYNANKKIYYSQIEQSIGANFSKIKKVAMLYNKEYVNLFIELDKRTKLDEKEIKMFLKKKFNIEKIIIKKIKKIPCDVKHNTKINYKELEKYV